MKFKKNRLISFIAAAALLLSGCSAAEAGTASTESGAGLTAEALAAGTEASSEAALQSSSDEENESVEISYATMFSVSDYEGCYLVDIRNEGQYLVVPEGREVPGEVPEGCTVIRQPLSHVYMASTPAMDLVDAAGGLDQVSFSCLQADDWYVADAKEKMENGSILYAGKYSKPDYEMLLSGGCDLAIENTMIYHSPQIKEKLEELGISVLVERSSYESSPLGRLEWVKLYGILFGKEAEADAFFRQEEQKVSTLEKSGTTGKTVAFFSVTSTGSVTVHKPGGYMAQMIEDAGGVYVPGSLPQTSEDGSALSTVHMQMEDFYDAAKDCDVLIYNSAIEGEVESVDDLIEKDAVFADFAAVKNGQVYCTDADFFQCVTKSCDFILDVNNILTQDDPGELLTMEKVS